MAKSQVIYYGARYGFFAGTHFAYMIIAGVVAFFAYKKMQGWQDGQIVFEASQSASANPMPQPPQSSWPTWQQAQEKASPPQQPVSREYIESLLADAQTSKSAGGKSIALLSHIMSRKPYSSIRFSESDFGFIHKRKGCDKWGTPY